jgi:hypothetical protein
MALSTFLSTDLALDPATWYNKSQPTFSDAIAAARRVLWTPMDLSVSRQRTETVEIPVRLLKRFVETLCLAARNAERRA